MSCKKILFIFLVAAACIGAAPHLTYSATWNPLVNDAFNRATTTVGAAGSTTGVGNNWTDVVGGVWNINSNQLQGTSADSSGYLSNFLIRPTNENATDQREVITIPSGTDYGQSLGSVLRYQTNSKNHYLAHISNSGIFIYKIVGSSVTLLSNQSISLDYLHTFNLDFSATGTSPTLLEASVTDFTSSTTLADISITDNEASLQASGNYGLSTWHSSGGNVVNVARVQTFNSSSGSIGSVLSPALPVFVSTGTSTISASTTVASGGASPYVYQWARATVSGGPYVNISGATGSTLHDAGLTADTSYYYIVKTIDASSTVATSSQIIIHTQPASLASARFGAIGDSIMTTCCNASGQSPITRMVSDLSGNSHFASVTMYNEAVSGKDSADWLPGGSLFTTILSDIQVHGINEVIIMLGTNDAWLTKHRPQSQYAANMTAIVDALRAAGVQKVFISYAPFIDYTANTQNVWDASSTLDVLSYTQAINSLDNGSNVRKIGASPSLYATTQAAPLTYLVDGVHLTVPGVNLFGDKWASDIDSILNPVASTPPVVSVAQISSGGAAPLTGVGGSSGPSFISPAQPIIPTCVNGALFNALTGARCSAASTPSVMMTPTVYIFTLNLTFGNSNPQVKLLQQYLNAKGFTVSASGAGSVGSETTTFGAATKAALIRFQKANEIMPASGYFGPITKAYISSH